MADKRKKNIAWTVEQNANGTYSYDAVHLVVLMDIRDELQGIRALLNCYRISKALDAIVAMHKQGVKRRVARKRKGAGK